MYSLWRELLAFLGVGFLGRRAGNTQVGLGFGVREISRVGRLTMQSMMIAFHLGINFIYKIYY